MSGNIGKPSVTVVDVQLQSHMALYDSLPAEKKRFLQQAPYDYACSEVANLSDAQITSLNQRIVQIEVSAAYGSDHPQAGAPWRPI